MYCHRELGIVVVPPPPLVCWTTSRTSRVVVWWPFRSVALRRMMDPAQVSAGDGGFVQTLAPAVNTESPAALSWNTPPSFIFSRNDHQYPIPNQEVVVSAIQLGPTG